MGQRMTDDQPLSLDAVLANCKVSENGCWLWLGACSPTGYASARINGRTRQLHRAVLERVNGKPLEKLFACHRCDVRRCVSPGHLFAGTQSDNMRDFAHKRRAKLGTVLTAAPPEKWLPRAETSKDAAITLRSRGLSYSKIGEEIGCSKKHAWMLVNA